MLKLLFNLELQDGENCSPSTVILVDTGVDFLTEAEELQNFEEIRVLRTYCIS